MAERKSRTLRAGSTLGSYAILELAGRGGMGEVYRARDERLHRIVAIKIVPKHHAANERRMARFKREAEAVAALSHPNILTIHDIGEDRGLSYMVTEHLEGATLRELLRSGALPTDKALAYSLQILNGLAAAHDKNIIHRDLKPDNIFVCSDDRIKILDFGLAKVEEPSSLPSSLDTPARLTRPQDALGTPGYMSPEQTRGDRTDARSDIFSFGVILREIVTGETSSASPADSRTPSPFVDSVDPSLFFEVEPIIRRCLEEDPNERFQSARDLAFSIQSLDNSSLPARRASAGDSLASIAILPFVDMSAHQDQEYFCDGMAEEILNALTQFSRLRVVARTSAFKFKGKGVDVRRIGQDLRVHAVLEGSVRTAGDRLRVTAKLIDVVNGFQLWSERYDRKLDDVFAIQDDIANRIVGKLECELLDSKTPQTRPRTNMDAYHSYLKARLHMSRRTAPALQKSVSYCESALEVDDRYGPAHACLADCLFLLAFQGDIEPKAAMPRARAAADKALEINSALGEAHTSLACIVAAYEWNWNESERAFSRAIELNPGYATAHYWYAIWHLIPTNQFVRAQEEIAVARKLDPLSPVLIAGLAWQFVFAGDGERALSEVEQALVIDDNFVMAHEVAAQSYGALGRFGDAVSAAERAVSLSENRTLSTGILGYAQARAGNIAAARETVDSLVSLREQRYVSAYDIALVYAGLDNESAALEWLERARDERNGWLLFLRADPRFDRLRTNPRFAAVTDSLGVSDAYRG